MKYKYSFFNDYSEGAHPNIFKSLQEQNLVQKVGYGLDDVSAKAADLLKRKIDNPSSDIHFVSGGTQANLIVLAALLKPYEAVIAVDTGHICVHEAGAIEATGHKICSVLNDDGKIGSNQIQQICNEHADEHMVQPRVVYISNSTEIGTIYSKRELEEISAVCKSNNLYLYLDGARLGSALASTQNDLGLGDLSKLTDVFYIGGTKNGAMLGEAIVINNQKLQSNFRRHLKQRGALLAKGSLLGTQFLELFTDDLYFQLAKHANDMASKLSQGIKDLGYKFLTESSTNQIFPIFTNEIVRKLEKDYGFYVWSSLDSGSSSIRLVTSWATPVSAIDMFLQDLKQISSQSN